MNGSVDLHTHTNTSDGTMTPEELMKHAMKVGLKIMALTDHDTVDGIDRAMEVPGVSEYIPVLHGGNGQGFPVISSDICGTLTHRKTVSVNNSTENSGHKPDNEEPVLQLIPGLEISTTWLEKDIHILGYYINRKDAMLHERLGEIQKRRADRNREMIALMRADGIPIREEDIPCSMSSVTRAHFAWFMTKLGITKNREEAFKKYIGTGCKYYLPKASTSPIEAIEIIKDSGGVPFMAHPMLARFSDNVLDELVGILTDHGLKGLEAYHSSHNPCDVQKSLALAEKYSLEVSTGSDFHAANKPDVFLGMGRGNICCNELPDILK